jgi:hypothetical protein
LQGLSGYQGSINTNEPIAVYTIAENTSTSIVTNENDPLLLNLSIVYQNNNNITDTGFMTTGDNQWYYVAPVQGIYNFTLTGRCQDAGNTTISFYAVTRSNNTNTTLITGNNQYFFVTEDSTGRRSFSYTLGAVRLTVGQGFGYLRGPGQSITQNGFNFYATLIGTY